MIRAADVKGGNKGDREDDRRRILAENDSEVLTPLEIDCGM
jgi:hypothetical protein